VAIQVEARGCYVGLCDPRFPETASAVGLKAESSEGEQAMAKAEQVMHS
jgi:hypothetical protein